MADLVWSVLCNRGILDQYTNNVTLVDVVEVLQLQALDEIPEGQRGAVPVQMALVTLWRRSDYSVPEKTAARFVLEIPDDDSPSLVARMVVDLETHRRSRTFVNVLALP